MGLNGPGWPGKHEKAGQKRVGKHDLVQKSELDGLRGKRAMLG
jgi:hypothetical protein